MAKSSSNELLRKYSKIFLNVSKRLQHVDIPQREQDALLRRYGRHLSIIYGYFVEFDPFKNQLEYFINNSAFASSKRTTNFKPLYVPYSEKENDELGDLFKSIKKNKREFKSLKNSPKIFQHLPVQNEAGKQIKQISDDYLNCFIPLEIKNKNDYYVVLFDEIIFFQFAYKFLKGESLDYFFADEKPSLFLYLIKFALSFEAKIGGSELHDKLENQKSKTWKDQWNSKQEIQMRKEISQEIKSVFEKGKVKEYLEIIEGLVVNLISIYKSKKDFSDIGNEIELLKLISRFDIETSFLITDKTNEPIPHDVFVFPLYTQSDNPILKTKFIDPNHEVGIYSPVLLVLYIKTLYLITNRTVNGKNESKPKIPEQNEDDRVKKTKHNESNGTKEASSDTKNDSVEPEYDEDEKSIDGFQLTKEITKQFAQRLVQEDYFKNVIQKEMQPAAIRAAIAQVMARNTSHNIGAHVMNKLIGNLREIALIQNPEKKRNYQSEQTLLQLHGDIVKKVESNAVLKEFQSEAIKNELLLNQIAIFNNYVKCRMDYLADISFGTPLMQTNKYAYTDLFKEFDKVRLLLEYISGLGENFKYEIKFNYNGRDMSDENDLPIAIPNDILGMQAFYNILENIIRNTAKHAQEKLPITTFTVDFIDASENLEGGERNSLYDYIAVEVYDNVPVKGNGRELTSEENDEYSRVMNSTRKPFPNEIDALVFLQNSRINTDILKDNQLRSGALGVVEMDASAAYLRKRDVSLINHDNYTVLYDNSWCANSIRAQNNKEERGTDCRHFLKAFKKYKIVNNNPAFVLGYRFFLLRPELVLVVTDIVKDVGRIRELKKHGIWLIPPDNFKKSLENGKVYNHEFVIISKNIELLGSKIKTYIQHKNVTEIDLMIYGTSLPLRIIEAHESELTALFNSLSDGNKNDWLNNFEGFCWEKWNKDFLKLDLPNGSIYPKKGGKFSSNLDHNVEGEYKIALDSNLYFYLDSLSSSAQSKLPGFKKGLIEYLAILKDSIIKLKLGESFYSKLLVIDERVQKHSEEEYLEIPLKTLYSMTGIMLPNINLSSSVLDRESILIEIENYIPGLDTQNCKNVSGEKLLNPFTDFIIIHYSILERIFNSDKEEIALLLKKWGKNANIVITSGRGEPENLPIEVRYINLSSVIHALIESRSKYFANYVFHSSRRSSKIKIS